MNRIKKLGKKRIVILVIIVILLVALVISLNTHKPKKENTKTLRENIADEVFNKKDLEGFEFSDIEINLKNRLFEYKVTVTNTNEEAKDFYGVAIKLIKDKKEIGQVEMYNKTTIEPRNSIILKNYSTKNYTEADKLEYTLIKETD